jgi:ComEC/Rec2-related protein
VIGAAVAGAFLTGFAFGWPLVPLVVGAALIAIVARPNLWIIGGLLVIGVTAGALRSPATRSHALESSWITQERNTGVVTSDVIDDGRSQRFRVEYADGRVLCARVNSRVDFGRGDKISADITADPATRISGGYAAFLQARRCDWSGTLESVTLLKSGTGLRREIDQTRHGISSRITQWVPGDPGALLAGLVIGDDSLMSDGAMDDFQTTGTLHVVAISGSNLTLLVSLLMVATVKSTRRRLLDALALVLIWGYVLIGGAGPPTVRAGFLATAAAGARSLGRPADLLTLSVQVAAIQAAIWPATVLGLSYQLSTVAIFGVLIATAGRAFHGIGGSLKLILVTTVVVNALLLPILPSSSRPTVLLSLIANTAIAPLVSLAFVLGIVAVLMGWVSPVLGEPVAILAGEINRATIAIVRTVAGWDGLPPPLDWDGRQAPVSLLWLLAAAVAMAVSTEFRRSVGDLRERAQVVTTANAELIFGAGIGACLAVAVMALIR